jgi:hypothetical protein
MIQNGRKDGVQEKQIYGNEDGQEGYEEGCS